MGNLDIAAIFTAAKKNQAAIRLCKRHRFEHTVHKLGERLTCLNCGGKLGAQQVVAYIQGYVAAGGDASEIWPAYKGELKRD